MLTINLEQLKGFKITINEQKFRVLDQFLSFLLEIVIFFYINFK